MYFVFIFHSSNVFRIGDPAQPRGGVNPAFTNYDEIWTWIPVVRGNQEDCVNECEQATGNRENNTAASSEALSRTLEPPPYSVAITTPSYPPGGATYTTATRSSESSRYLYSVSNEASHVPSSNCASSHITTCTTSISRPIVSSSVSVSNIVSASGERGHNSNVSNNIRQKNDSNIGKTNEIEHSRNAQRTWDVRDPWRRPEVTRPDVAMVTDTESHMRGRQSRDMARPRTHILRDVRSHITSSISDDITYAFPTEHSANSCHDDIESIYPELFGNEASVLAHAQRMRREFVYDADAGLYSFTTESNGRRVWCDIPPSLLDEEGPPPYTPAPDYPVNRNRQQRRRERSRPKAHNSVNDRPAPIVRYCVWKHVVIA